MLLAAVEALGTVSDMGPVVRLQRKSGGNLGAFPLHITMCPACGQYLLASEQGLLWPQESSSPRTAAAAVPQDIAEDFNESAAVLCSSPKASAALSRRCLQNVLRSAGHATGKSLSAEIESILPSLPSHLRENVDAIRIIGNLAAHPEKDKQTGSIWPVEPEEAGWLLDVLEGLFDFYYVGPERDKARRDALNAKLQRMGKPPMKG